MAERSYERVIQRLAEMINRNMRRELDIRDQAIAELREQLERVPSRLEKRAGRHSGTLGEAGSHSVGNGCFVFIW